MGQCPGFEVVSHFAFDGTVTAVRPHGNGHINHSYKVTCDTGANYLLQRVNTEIFQHPEQLMANIIAVTAHLARKVANRGGDVSREVLTLVPTRAGDYCHIDQAGEYWRAYNFVTQACSFDLADDPRLLRESGRAFGEFQRDLADFPAAELAETIPNFHNTAVRLQTFRDAVATDACGRAGEVKAEIDHYLRYAHLAQLFTGASALPLRVTHNDTKLNNVMFDRTTGKAICVVDLDTVMPGLAVHDFGDAIRFGAATALEDEVDLAKMSCSPQLFRAYTEGFLRGVGGQLTEAEIAGLVSGAKQMTFECGIRFLTDYLQGDQYFRITRRAHNLDRARSQLALLDSIEAQSSALEAIVTSCAERFQRERP